MDPQISLFSNFFIKNGSHGTIYTFKNYFAIVISAISFQFQQNPSANEWNKAEGICKQLLLESLYNAAKAFL